MESIQRLYSREADRDEPTDLATRDAQLAAITAWGIPDASKLNRLAGITQPTFVANGDNDTMMHTRTAGCSPSIFRTPRCGSIPTPGTASSTNTQNSSETTSGLFSTSEGSTK